MWTATRTVKAPKALSRKRFWRERYFTFEPAAKP
jgi:hypothetical protein